MNKYFKELEIILKYVFKDKKLLNRQLHTKVLVK